MHWIALQWPPEPKVPGALPPTAQPAGTPSPEALGWWALQFTPRVTWADEVLLMEVSTSLRLWGGWRALLQHIHKQNPIPTPVQSAQAAIGLVAMAMLRQRVRGETPARERPAGLPLDTLSAARPHLDLLARLGCQRWGDVHALPRGPLVRRLGPELRAALDIAWGLAPESYRWHSLPEMFDQSLELPARVDEASALLWATHRLLCSLQIWLRARQRGVLAFELAWRLDLKRLDGRELPSWQSLPIRTAEPVQSMDHLRRLLTERLARTTMLAPAVHLRLRALDTVPWHAGSASLLGDASRAGDPLHVFIERVSARLGADQVLAPHLCADHRPERMQRWQAAAPALHASADRAAVRARPAAAADCTPSLPGESAKLLPDALAPSWLLREPQPLSVQGDGQPCWRGPLRLLTGPRRVDAGWWPDAEDATASDPNSRCETGPWPLSEAHLDGATAPGLPVRGELKFSRALMPSIGHSAVGAPSGGSTTGKVAEHGNPISRDYYIAQNPRAELLWIYRERPTQAQRHAEADGGRSAPRWFLHGIYA